MLIHNRYLQINAASSDLAKAHAETIPAFLQNKPKNVVQFCFKRWREAEEINHSNVDEISSGVYFQTHQDKVYEVNTNANHVCLPPSSLRNGNLFLDNPFIGLDIGPSNNCLSAQPENATEEHSNKSHPHETQQINISAIKRQRNLVGSAFRQLTDIAYHCQDMDVLRKISTQLEVKSTDLEI
ncbi:unnamed protein product [Mytilus edulis]|uniref:Uncharacterized protein n=1 Tax=Mytilus edulis TaxID=6550 RepID=A0A8S3QPG7_MYTED|nr:unnamed protein product [Mytilus edulis]